MKVIKEFMMLRFFVGDERKIKCKRRLSFDFILI